MFLSETAVFLLQSALLLVTNTRSMFFKTEKNFKNFTSLPYLISETSQFSFFLLKTKPVSCRCFSGLKSPYPFVFLVRAISGAILPKMF